MEKDDIIEKAKLGDTVALSLLIDDHKSLAYNLAFRILKNHNDSKDVVQDSFIKVLEKIQQFQYKAKFSTWLYRIVLNEALKKKHDNKRKAIVPLNTSVDMPTVDEAEDPSIDSALETLTEKEKLVITLFYLAEKSIKEINEITGLSISNIKILLHRARLQLKKQLKAAIYE